MCAGIHCFVQPVPEIDRPDGQTGALKGLDWGVRGFFSCEVRIRNFTVMKKSYLNGLKGISFTLSFGIPAASCSFLPRLIPST